MGKQMYMLQQGGRRGDRDGAKGTARGVLRQFQGRKRDIFRNYLSELEIFFCNSAILGQKCIVHTYSVGKIMWHAEYVLD